MRKNLALVGAAVAASVALLVAQPATAEPARPGNRPASDPSACSPSIDAISYSDALNKLQAYGAEVSGLSSLAWDARQHAWVSALDNNGQSTPEYIWSFRNLADPEVIHAPLILRKPDGTPYDGGNIATDPNAADNEGLAVLKDGDYAVSSETEPSIRIYGRDGVQKESLPIPARFGVTGLTPGGQATSNATLEGLTLTPNGKTLIASMEGALSGDVSSSGDATSHRLLVYTLDRRGEWTLEKQIEYKTDAGMRIPEVAAYSNDGIVVEEAAWSATTGNEVNLFSVTGLSRAADVSSVADLADAPASLAVHKRALGDLVNCPTLGAPALEFQQNPLLDNFEGMAITGRERNGRYGLSLISDDNNSPQQHTRVLNLSVKLP